MSFKMILIASIVILVVVVAQMILAGEINRRSEIANESCAFQSWSKDDSWSSDYEIRLHLTCSGDRKVSTTDKDVILGFLAKPEAALVCSIRKVGDAHCQVPN